MNATTTPKDQRDMLTVGYIIKGFWEKLADIGTAAFESGAPSEMDVMSQVISLADIDDEFFKTHGNDAGLIWAYEISEPFGAEVAVHVRVNKEFPNAEQAGRILASIYENATSGFGGTPC